jgi:hypothetical protein
MLGGMITFRESGRFVLREAVDHAKRRREERPEDPNGR